MVKDIILNKILTIAILIMASAISSCKKEGCTDDNATNFNSKAKTEDGSCIYEGGEKSATVQFKVNHLVNGEPIEFDNMKYTSVQGYSYDVRKLYYFLSEPSLKIEGETISLPQAHYFDGKNESTLVWNVNYNFPIGKIEEVGVRFGFNDKMNDTINFPTFPAANMSWPASLGGGWHYMQLEGGFKLTPDTQTDFYNTHTGPTDGNDNSFFSTFDVSSSDYSVSGEQTIIVTLNIELTEFYVNPNEYDFTENSFIMNKQNIQEQIQQNGESVIDLESLIIQ